MKKFLLLILVFIFLLFNSRCKKENNKLHEKIIFLTGQYNITRDKIYLKKAYNLIKNSNEFKKHGLTTNNIHVFGPVFLELKKFNELDSLVSQIHPKDKKTEELLKETLIFIQYSKYKEKNDTLKIKRYIEKIIEINAKQLRINPKDSNRYISYFIFKSKIYPESLLIKELDSIKNSGYISDFMYELILDQMKKNDKY